ncbi:MAG: hypothetical protein V4592_04960 [Bacteroidota bacterium]
MISTLKRPVFKLSVLSALLLFFSIAFGEELWSDYWMYYAFIEMFIVASGGMVLVWSIIFWFDKPLYRLVWLPCCINVLTAAIVIFMPLNWLRNKVWFTIRHHGYEAAANMALNAKSDTAGIYLYPLPGRYHSLSAGGGEAYVIRQKDAKAVFFYTLRQQDSKKGFVKIDDGKKIDQYLQYLCNEVYIVKPMGGNWYYVSGD